MNSLHVQMPPRKRTRRPMAFSLVLCAALCALAPLKSADAGPMTDKLEGEKAHQIRMSGTLRYQLEKQTFLAVHGRTEEYPRREDYADLTYNLKRVEVPPRFSRPTPAPGPGPTPIYAPGDIREMVRYASTEYSVDEYLILAVIKAESNFDTRAVSPAGARGLMQLMPGTAAELGVTDPFDPAQNIMGGTQYLARMTTLFKQEELVLAAYNAGPGTVRRYGGVPPYKETQKYIKRVTAFRAQYAAGELGAAYEPGDQRTKPDSLPEYGGATYVLTLKGGFTQRAEVIVDNGDYYLIAFKGQQARIRKQYIESVEQKG